MGNRIFALREVLVGRVLDDRDEDDGELVRVRGAVLEDLHGWWDEWRSYQVTTARGQALLSFTRPGLHVWSVPWQWGVRQEKK